MNSMVIFHSFLLTFTRPGNSSIQSPGIPRHFCHFHFHRCRGWPGRQLLQKKLTEFEHVHQSSPGVQPSAAEQRTQPCGAASAGFCDGWFFWGIKLMGDHALITLWWTNILLWKDPPIYSWENPLFRLGHFPLLCKRSPGRVSFLIIIFHHFSGEKLALRHGNFMETSDP